MSASLPELLEILQDGPSKVRLRLRLSPDILYFDGHFPGVPILPAVVQIDWAMHYAQRFLSLAGVFRGMDRLKFRRALCPLDEPELELESVPEKQRLEFSYASPRGCHSSGRLWID